VFPPIRNVKSVFLFFAAAVVFSRAIRAPWLASISRHLPSNLSSLPTACVLASAQHLSNDACSLSAGLPVFLSCLSFFWPSFGRPSAEPAAGASGLYCSVLLFERALRVSAQFSHFSMRA
jgi:hypothetical protein